MRFPEYDTLDATALAALVAAGQLTPGELLDAALERADARDPPLNAIVHRFDEEARRPTLLRWSGDEPPNQLVGASIGIGVVFWRDQKLEEPLELVEDDQVGAEPLDRSEGERVPATTDQFFRVVLQEFAHPAGDRTPTSRR